MIRWMVAGQVLAAAMVAMPLHPAWAQSPPESPGAPVPDTNGDDATAFHRLAVAAGQGDAAAQYQLGRAYYEGKQLPRDDQLAAHWIRESAQQGFAEAECQWAEFEQQGVDTAIDLVDAVSWLRKSAEQGDARAMYLLGLALRDGAGITLDPIQAATWFARSANLGDVDAQIAIGVVLLKGDGVAVDHDGAIAWFRRAGDQGSAEARYRLATALLGEEPPAVPRTPGRGAAEGIEALGLAAGQNYPPALYRLGLAHLGGIDAELDIDQGLRLIGAAADRGYGRALARLGEIYRDGKLVAADPVRAYVNLELAVRAGEIGADGERNAVAAALNPDEMRLAKQQIEAWQAARRTPKAGEKR